jgi:hypothetical protein
MGWLIVQAGNNTELAFTGLAPALCGNTQLLGSEAAQLEMG